MKRYVGFVDPSGGGSDSMTVGIAHGENGKAILDGVWEEIPPFSPQDAARRFAVILKRYGISRIQGDRYSGEWVREAFRSEGITYEPCAMTKSELYAAFLALTNSGRISIPLHRRLLAQLQRLERRVARGGRESVDHVAGGHDDVANAAAGALVLAAKPAKKFFEPFVMDVHIGRTHFPSGDPDPNGDPYNAAADLPWDAWRKLN